MGLEVARPVLRLHQSQVHPAAQNHQVRDRRLAQAVAQAPARRVNPAQVLHRALRVLVQRRVRPVVRHLAQVIHRRPAAQVQHLVHLSVLARRQNLVLRQAHRAHHRAHRVHHRAHQALAPVQVLRPYHHPVYRRVLFHRLRHQAVRLAFHRRVHQFLVHRALAPVLVPVLLAQARLRVALVL